VFEARHRHARRIRIRRGPGYGAERMGEPREQLSFCRICAALCGIVVKVDRDRVLEVRGDPDHPISRGYTCPKGRALPSVHHHPDRLDVPRLGKNETEWDTLLDDLADRIAAVRSEHGPQAVGAYLATGLAYDFNGWMTAERFLGLLHTKQRYTPVTIDNAAILRAAELVAGNMQLSTVWDPDDSKLLVLFGTNPVVSHGYGTTLSDPITRIREFRRRGGELWVIDPLRTETAGLADEHIAIRPGTDQLVLAWLVRELLIDGADAEELDAHTDPRDLATLRELLAPCTLPRVAAAADVPEAQLHGLLAAIRRAGRLASLVGTGVVMHRTGLVAAWLRWVLLVVTGSADRPGGMRVNPGYLFPLEGRRFRAAPPDGSFDGSVPSRPDLPRWAGQYPCAAMVDEIEAGNLRALLILGGNPLTAFPDPERTARAFARLDVLAVADVFDHELTQLATHVLPATAQLERADLPMIEGPALSTGTQYTDAIVAPAAQRKPVWWMLGQLGRRLELDVLDGIEADQCTDRMLLARVADASRGTADAVIAAGSRGITGPSPSYGWVHEQVLPEGRWRLAPSALVDRLRVDLDALDELSVEHVLIPRRQLRSMNSARYEHADRRGGEQPIVRCNRADAAAHALHDGETVTVTSRHGSTTGVVLIDDRVRPGVISMTHGWTTVNPCHLTSVVEDVDPLTGMICQSGVPVSLSPAR
jgi:anaerobic selenocysteine-containing dehydrogenase